MNLLVNFKYSFCFDLHFDLLREDPLPRLFNRRTFLRTSLLSTLALAATPSWGALREPTLTPGHLNLYHTHTGERLSVTYRDARGEYDLDAIDAMNRLLRCHHTDEVRQIDLRTIEFLAHVDRRLGAGKEIHIVSAFRSPAYNEQLRRQGRRVADNSLHLQGRAIDFRIPATPLKTLRSIALDLRFGGVGYYPGSEFLHLDSGTFRTW